jgi:hypothetical protein
MCHVVVVATPDMSMMDKNGKKHIRRDPTAT